MRIINMVRTVCVACLFLFVGVLSVEASKIIEGVPNYNQDDFPIYGLPQYEDCGPVACAMLHGYYDAKGWPRLIPYGTNEFSLNAWGIDTVVRQYKKELNYVNPVGAQFRLRVLGNAIERNTKYFDQTSSFISNDDEDTSWERITKDYLDKDYPCILVVIPHGPVDSYKWEGDSTLREPGIHGVCAVGWSDEGGHWIICNFGWHETRRAWFNADTSYLFDNWYISQVTPGGSSSGEDDDQYEDNDTMDNARQIETGTINNLRCLDTYLADYFNKQGDWYKVNVAPGQILSVTIAFSHANGDLDLMVFSSNKDEVYQSEGTGNTETVNFSPASSGYYYIFVYGKDGAKNSNYSLNVALSGGVSNTKVIGISGDLAFGDVAVNSSSSRTMTIANTGNSTLNVTDISCPVGFSVSPKSFAVLSNGSKDVTVTFSPTSAQSFSSTITVSSDKTSGTNTKACSGTGVGVGSSQVVITSPSGNPYETGNSSVVFHGLAPVGSVKVQYSNALTGDSDLNWDTVESDGTWGGRSVSLLVGSNPITITARNAQGSVTGSASITITRKNNIRETSTADITCAVIFSGKTKTAMSDAYVGYDASTYLYGVERTLVKFNLPVLPSGSQVTGAEFRGVTYNSSSDQHGTSFKVTTYRINEAWSAGVTWNSFIIGGTIPYITNGSNSQSVPGANSWVYWNVSEICQSWYSGSPNYGLIMIAEYSVENGGVWRDRWFDKDKFNLKITYEVETTPPTVAISVPTAANTYSTSSATINLSGVASDTQNTIASVTWKNDATGGNGTCSGTRSWNVSNVALAPGINQIVVTAVDAAGNSATDVLEVTYNPPQKTIRLSGTLNFGDVVVGDSGARDLYICNDGDAALAVTDIVCPTGFIVDWTNGVVPAGQSQRVVVTFQPTTSRGYSDTIAVSSDKTGGDGTIACSGIGITPTRVIRVEGEGAFGNIATNASRANIVTIHNDGTKPLLVTGVEFPPGFSGNWNAGAIPAGASYSLVVTFSPVAVQSYEGVMSVNSDKTSGTNTLSLLGAGVTATRILRLAGDLSFGDVPVGASVTRGFTIYNDGNSPLSVTDIVCPPCFNDNWNEALIPGGSSRDVIVTFSPANVQTYNGIITVNSDKTSGTNTLSLLGAGVTATRILRLAGDLSFGDVPVGASVTRGFTIYNDGNSPLSVTDIVCPPCFNDNWNEALIPGGSSRDVIVTFSPTALQSYSGTVSVASNRTGGENTSGCSGVGIAATRIIRLTGDLTFGEVDLGRSVTRLLKVFNDGNCRLTITSVSCASGFSVSPTNFVISAGGVTNINVVFCPIATQLYSGSILVNSDKTGGENHCLCSGTGIETVAAPVFDPDGGIYDGTSLCIMISYPTNYPSEGVTLQYTTDGSEPTEANSTGTSWVVASVPLPGVLKAKACKTGLPASVTKTATYSNVVASNYLYLVIDLSGGAGASQYPVSYLAAPPSGGWSDEYKTTKLVMRRIPKGSFTMGSPASELGHESNETLHNVTLTHDFYIGVFEVTLRQWELVMGSSPSPFDGASRPVSNVSYDSIRGAQNGAQWPANGSVDAGSFMWNLRLRTGLSFDLPSESQWEYACRAGTSTALNSGKNLTSVAQDPNMAEVGRYYYNEADGKGGYTSLTTVGCYAPNAWGLFDMHGNVVEWCLDWHGTYPATAIDPAGPESGTGRVKRGGCVSENYLAGCCRSASRTAVYSAYSDWCDGFRVARTISVGNPLPIVTLDDHGGTFIPQNMIMNFGLPFGALPELSRVGYLFNGWWTGTGGTSSRVTSETIVSKSAWQTLYANWIPLATSRTPVAVPYAWLDRYPILLGQAGNDYETMALADVDGDGHTLWQEYVGGSNPTNRESVLRILLAMSNGVPWVTWTPDIGSERVYVVEGKSNLTDSAWGQTNAGSRFFRVKADLKTSAQLQEPPQWVVDNGGFIIEAGALKESEKGNDYSASIHSVSTNNITSFQVDFVNPPDGGRGEHQMSFWITDNKSMDSANGYMVIVYWDFDDWDWWDSTEYMNLIRVDNGIQTVIVSEATSPIIRDASKHRIKLSVDVGIVSVELDGCTKITTKDASYSALNRISINSYMKYYSIDAVFNNIVVTGR